MHLSITNQTYRRSIKWHHSPLLTSESTLLTITISKFWCAFSHQNFEVAHQNFEVAFRALRPFIFWIILLNAQSTHTPTTHNDRTQHKHRRHNGSTTHCSEHHSHPLCSLTLRRHTKHTLQRHKWSNTTYLYTTHTHTDGTMIDKHRQ